MKLPIVRVRDADGNVKDIPAIVGPRGPIGPEGPVGPRGEQGMPGVAADVYNVVLVDTETKKRYALMAENGVLVLMETNSKLDATNCALIDTETGVAYKLVVSSGKLAIEEV